MKTHAKYPVLAAPFYALAMLCLITAEVRGAQQFTMGTHVWDNGVTAAWG